MLAERLLELRTEHTKTQKQVADYLRITRPAYTAYERGTRQPDYETLKKLASFFNVTTDYLLGKTDKKDGQAYQKQISQSDDTYDSLAEINKLVKKYGIEDLGFFDIEKWKNLGPEDIRMIDAQFKAAAEFARKRNEEK